jgi:hypothetical protein
VVRLISGFNASQYTTTSSTTTTTTTTAAASNATSNDDAGADEATGRPYSRLQQYCRDELFAARWNESAGPTPASAAGMLCINPEATLDDAISAIVVALGGNGGNKHHRVTESSSVAPARLLEILSWQVDYTEDNACVVVVVGLGGVGGYGGQSDPSSLGIDGVLRSFVSTNAT